MQNPAAIVEKTLPKVNEAFLVFAQYKERLHSDMPTNDVDGSETYLNAASYPRR